jgi:hypothetical protein
MGHPPWEWGNGTRPTRFAQNEVNMKRERLTQIVLVIVGLLNLAIIYFLYMDLRHSKLAFGAEERDRADVSELLYSGRSLSTHRRKETI